MKNKLVCRNKCSFWVVFLLLVLCSTLYYFGELIDFAGWDALRLDFFYGVHDIQRLLYLAPILYSAYIFGARAMIVVTILAACSMLVRALSISPFPDPVLRPAIFCIVAGMTGYVIARLRSQSEEHERLQAIFANERDNFLTTIERMNLRVLIIDPNYRIRFTHPYEASEIDRVNRLYCYEYLYRLNSPCEENCRLKRVVEGSIEQWDCVFQDGKPCEVSASPYVDTDGTICQLTVIRDASANGKQALLGQNTNPCTINKLKDTVSTNAALGS